MALRLRRINGGWLQTLKAADGRAGVTSQRGEWETPAATAADGTARLDLRRFRESPLASLLARRKSKPRLSRQFSTHVQRTQWMIERGQAQIEVALDVGEIRAIARRSERGVKELSEPICEVEIELKRGDAASIVDLAIELLDCVGKHPLLLLPLGRSKAERGYQLAAGGPAEAIKASAKGFTERLFPKMPLAHALRAVMGHGLAVMTTNCELLLRDDEPEYVHQARVALRRVRSAIRLFDRDRRDVPESLIGELKWFASALGVARDWDVMTDQTLPQLATIAGPDVITDALREKAQQRRRNEWAKLRRAVRSTRYAALALHGERWVISAAPGDSKLLEDAAARTLQRLATKLFRSACFFSALSPTRRHRVRIHAKRLRYALDLFSTVLPRRACARYVDALAALQESLGELNDASVARALFKELREATALRTVDQWFASNEADRLRQIEVRLLALSELAKPWR